MPTQYVTQAQLEALFGPHFVAQALQEGMTLDTVFESIHSEVDAYVSKQVQMPPTAEAVAQVRPAAAKLIAHQLYIQTPSEALTASAQDARRFLESVASGKVLLHTAPAVCEDPATCKTGFRFAFSSAPRVLSDKSRRAL
ncbi:phage protein Gp36 family protein [Comamonas terrigena]|uniref:phage protein Gp36 family protein n=1 Tax=Comamonas terrigena TaxID=32013 RepID=UPI0028A146F4|nr:phage protein Gp36 family protein [Comamonas terrigena]